MTQTRHQETALAKPFSGQQLHHSHGEPASDLLYSLLGQSLCHPLGNVPSHLPNEISNQTPKQDESPPERKQSGLKYVIASGAWAWVNVLVRLWRPLLGKSWIQGNRNLWVPATNAALNQTRTFEAWKEFSCQSKNLEGQGISRHL